MRNIHFWKSKIGLALISLLVGSTVMAQDVKLPAEKTISSPNNQLVILMMITIGLLAFVIWGLGRALLEIGRQVLDKSKNANKAINTFLAIGLLLLVAQTSSAQNASATNIVKVLPNYGGISPTTFYMLVAVIVTEIIIIAFLTYSIKRLYAELMPGKIPALAKAKKAITWWTKLDKKLTRAIPLDKEADVLLDHDYDGIKELDNPLPPWWKYGFYLTIGVAIIYLLNFHVLGYGKNPTQEYNAEMVKAGVEKELYEANNKDKIDENKVPMADAAGLMKAKEIFTTKCFACHGKDGQGGAGPNLTDDFWLHKGSLNDIYRTIKNGYPDKGMQSWAMEYTPKEISYLASYVKKLHATNPPSPKAPQGDLYVDPSQDLPVSDSIKGITSTTHIK